MGLFPLQVVVPAAFLDILVFPSSVLQRGEVRENANSPAGPNFVPKNLRNKRRFKQSGQRPHFPKSRRSVVFPWFLENSTRNMSLLGTKHRAKKRRRRTKFCSQQRPIRGRIRIKKHNNQPHDHFNTCLGRASLHFWVDWATVALSVSVLVSGPFSCDPTQVDCFE